MTFNVIAVRDAQVDDNIDDELYPAIGDENLIHLGAPDGSSVQTLVAKSILVHELTRTGLLPIAATKDTHIDVFVTDCRVALACEKFIKGGGWIGIGTAGLAVALTANAVSKARARARRKGKILVGQVRYPWVKQIGFRPKRALRNDGQIRLVIEDGTGSVVRSVAVDLGLPTSVDAGDLALKILHRAVQYRLQSDVSPASDETRAALVALSEAPRLIDPAPGKFALYSLPTHQVAKGSNAAQPQGADPV